VDRCKAGQHSERERWRKRAADPSNARTAGGDEETKGRCAAGRHGRELSLAQAVRMGRGLGRTSEIVRKTVGTGEDACPIVVAGECLFWVRLLYNSIFCFSDNVLLINYTAKRRIKIL
jgi:hypothetical protein